MPIADLGPAADRLCTLIGSVSEEDLTRPTPCVNYTVGDLLDHLQGVTFAFAGAATKAGGEAATMGPSGDVSKLDPEWRITLPRRIGSLVEAWRSLEAWTGMTRVGGNDLPGEVAGVVSLGELVIHGWDLARATDQPFDADTATLMPLFELVRSTFGPGGNAPRGEAFGPPVPVPEDASRLDQVLGMLGRDPGWKRPGL
jgi:uncharacterized protein (TIGR03086 family)